MTNQIKLIFIALVTISFLSGCSQKPQVIEKIVYKTPKQYEFNIVDLNGAAIELQEVTMRNVVLQNNKYISSNSENPTLYAIIDDRKNEILFTPKGIQRLATDSLIELDTIHKGIRDYYEWQFKEASKGNNNDKLEK